MAAVRVNAASKAGQASAQTGPQGPIRTCIGCRARASAAELLRVVVAPGSVGAAAPVVPDPRRRAPGRGAWVHPDPVCVEQAQRRRAFVRALRVPGPVDAEPVVQYVAELHNGTPLGDNEHEQAMKPQP